MTNKTGNRRLSSFPPSANRIIENCDGHLIRLQTAIVENANENREMNNEIAIHIQTSSICIRRQLLLLFFSLAEHQLKMKKVGFVTFI